MTSTLAAGQTRTVRVQIVERLLEEALRLAERG